MKILITGGTGFVGRRLISKLPSHECVVTTRNAARAKSTLGDSIVDAIQWDSPGNPLNLGTHTNFGAVVNLMGESIADGRWNKTKKARIRSSRIDATNNLVAALLKLETRPMVVVSASAVGMYGDCGDEIVKEDHAPADGFLADVCRDWEQATEPLSKAGIRVVKLRIGIVLGEGGGALEKLLPIFKLGMGGKLGDGRQYVPWIHLDDLVGLICWAIETTAVSGPVNATSPNPVRNSELTKTLAQVVNRPAIIPVPKFALRIAVGEFADSLLVSQQVIPEAALNAGYQFQYPNLEPALQEIVKS